MDPVEITKTFHTLMLVTDLLKKGMTFEEIARLFPQDPKELQRWYEVEIAKPLFSM